MTIRTIAHKRLVVGEKKQRFGFRKTILGLCGAILGSTLLMADVANNAHTVHAAEFDPDQAKSVQKGNNTANGLNGKVGQPLAKKEVPQLNSSLKQDEKAGADKNQGADKGATGTGADKSGSQLGSQTGAQGAGKGTQGTGTGADKGAQGNKSADVAGKYVPNQNQVTTHSKDTHSEVTGKTASTNATSTNEYSASASNLSKTGAASTSNSTAVKTNAKYANSVETVDNNKRGNRENTHFISQRRIINLRRIVKRSAVKTEATSPSKALLTGNEALTHVTKDNFLDYFSLNGSVVLIT